MCNVTRMPLEILERDTEHLRVETSKNKQDPAKYYVAFVLILPQMFATVFTLRAAKICQICDFI